MNGETNYESNRTTSTTSQDAKTGMFMLLFVKERSAEEKGDTHTHGAYSSSPLPLNLKNQ